MSGSVEPQQQMRPNSLTAVHLERFSRPLLNLVHGDAWTNVSLWRDGESHHPQMKKTVAKPPGVTGLQKVLQEHVNESSDWTKKIIHGKVSTDQRTHLRLETFVSDH